MVSTEGCPVLEKIGRERQRFKIFFNKTPPQKLIKTKKEGWLVWLSGLSAGL